MLQTIENNISYTVICYVVMYHKELKYNLITYSFAESLLYLSVSQRINKNKEMVHNN